MLLYGLQIPDKLQQTNQEDVKVGDVESITAGSMPELRVFIVHSWRP